MPLKFLKLDSWPAMTMDPLQATIMDHPHQAIAQVMHILPVVPLLNPLLVQLRILDLAEVAAAVAAVQVKRSQVEAV